MVNNFTIPAAAKNVKLSMTRASVQYSTPNVSSGNNTMRIIGQNTSQVLTVYDLTIPNGIYDFFSLKDYILSFLESPPPPLLPARSNPLPIISIDASEAQQKVILTLNYADTVVDFSARPNSVAPVLGFRPTDVLAFPVAFGGGVFSVIADDVAAFDTLKEYHIHSDLVQEGVTVNGTMAQILSPVTISVAPQDLIVYEPYYPATSSGNHLAGDRRSEVRCWITDEKENKIDMAGDPWSFNLRIEYTV